MGRQIQNFVYEAAGKILYHDQGDQFVARGIVPGPVAALALVDASGYPDRLIVMMADGSFSSVARSPGNLVADLGDRFAAWSRRDPCPSERPGDPRIKHDTDRRVCLLAKGHEGKHNHAGLVWDDPAGTNPSPPAGRWYAYDPATEGLWLWNGPDKNGFVFKGKFRGTPAAFVMIPDATIVTLNGTSWRSACGPLAKLCSTVEALAKEWHEYAKAEKDHLTAPVPADDDIRIYVPGEKLIYKRLTSTVFRVIGQGIQSPGFALAFCGSGPTVFEYAPQGHGCVLRRLRGAAGRLGDLMAEFETWHQKHIAPSAAPAAVVTLPDQHPDSRPPRTAPQNYYPDYRPAPTGPCSFCEEPANRWCRDYAVCPAAECNAGEFFHVERLAAGSVDTPETRAEARRYAVIYLADQAIEEAEKKPEGSCAFCVDPGNYVIQGALRTCGKHDRAGCALRDCLALGGVSDTPQLRQEVLRRIAAHTARVARSECEEKGARTNLDYQVTLPYPIPHPSLTDRQQERPPPEEVPLVGTTPHYEWP